MKKISKLITIILAFCIVISCTACGGNQEVVSKYNKEGTYHYVANTLHEVDVDFDHPVGDFVKAGQSDYIVRYIADAQVATTFLVEQVASATGYVLSYEMLVLDDMDSITNSDKYIILGDKSIAESKEIDMPTIDELGVAGYYIVTEGQMVYILAHNKQGFHMGVLAFLKAVLGYEAYSADTIKFSKSGELMPSIEIKERPDTDYRQIDNVASENVEEILGFTSGNIFYQYVTDGKNVPWVHNCKSFVGLNRDDTQTDVFGDECTIESISEDGIYRKWFSNDSTMWQMCYTAHGDVVAYKRLVERFANYIIKFMELHPECNNICFSQNDVTTGSPDVGRCTCPSCNASFNRYNNTFGCSELAILSDAMQLVNEYKEEYGLMDREFNLVMLVYGSCLPSPTKKADGKYLFDENGLGIPDTLEWPSVDGKTMTPWNNVFGDSGDTTDITISGNEGELVKTWGDIFGSTEVAYQHATDGVSFMFAASGSTMHWINTMYEEINQPMRDQMMAWKGMGGKMYVWGYEVCYHAYFYPANTYDSLAESIRFFKSIDTKWIYYEGSYENYNYSGFSKFRTYLNAKFEFDVNLRYGDLIDDFFENYFDVAAEPMREMFDMCQIILRDLEAKGIYSGNIQSEEFNSTKIFSYGNIQSFLRLIDEAYEKIEVYKDSNPTLYNTLKKHITIESFFPRFAMCDTYSSTFTSEEELTLYRIAFKNDFEELNPISLRTHKEHYTIDTMYEAWGIA